MEWLLPECRDCDRLEVYDSLSPSGTQRGKEVERRNPSKEDGLAVKSNDNGSLEDVSPARPPRRLKSHDCAKPAAAAGLDLDLRLP